METDAMKIERLTKELAAAQEKIQKLEVVAQSLLNHRNTWFSDQQQAMAAAGYQT